MGDSGTGKTFVCLKLASEYNLKVHVISLGHLAATHSGQVEKGIRHVQWHLTEKSLGLS
jgi:SpoVK/Ycf46/Vps4 family AAA+-type ATPase